MTDAVPMTPRPLTDSDWPAVEAAFAHSFRDCRLPAVWAWRYLRASGNWLGWVVPAPDGGIAAFVGGSLHRGWCYGKEATFILGRDGFTHPAWRGQLSGRRGLFARTEREFLAACAAHGPLCLGFILDRRLKLGELLGINRPYRSGHWYRLHLSPGAMAGGCSALVRPADFGAACWDDFWERRKAAVRCSLVRDSEFLNWRFDVRQGREYWRFALTAVDSTVPLGYIVLTDSGAGRAVLVDAAFVCTQQAARDGWQQVVAWLWRRGIREVITFVGAGCPERVLWPMLGFVVCEPPLPTAPAYWLTDETLSPELFERDYALTLADSDLF